MGKFLDLVLAILVLVIGLYILTRLGITWSGIWKMVHTFFFGSSSTTNSTASSVLVGMAASNSKMRNKIKERRELLIRQFKIKEITGLIGRRMRGRA